MERVYSLVVLIISGLAIGVHVTAFSAFDTVFSRLLQIPDSNNVLHISCSTSSFPNAHPCSIPVAVEVRSRSALIEDLAYFSSDFGPLRYQDTTSEVLVERVSSSFFSVLRKWPTKGRAFMTSDNSAPQNSLIILSDAAWQSYFHRAQDVLGNIIFFKSIPFVVCGVMPSDFTFPDAKVQGFILNPLAVEQMQETGVAQSVVIARLNGEGTLDQFRTELTVISHDLSNEDPIHASDLTFRATPLQAMFATSSSRGIWMVFLGSAVWALLVVPMLVDVLRRFGVSHYERLGATTSTAGTRLTCFIRDLECLGTLVGTSVVYVWGTTRIVQPLALGESPIGIVVLNKRVAAYSVGVSVLIWSLVRLFALCSHVSRVTLRSDDTKTVVGMSGGWIWLLRGGVVAQSCAAVIAVACAISALEVLWQQRHSDLGFEPQGLVTISFIDNDADLPESSDHPRPLRSMLSEVSALPHVEAAAIGSFAPFSGAATRIPVGIVLPHSTVANPSWVEVQGISGQYFQVLGTRILAGRTLDHLDEMSPECVVIVNRSFVHSVLHLRENEKALGMIISETPVRRAEEKCTVVGVAVDIRRSEHDEGTMPSIYVPYTRWPDVNHVVLIRTRSESAIQHSLPQIVHRYYAATDVRAPVVLDELVERSTLESNVLAHDLMLGASVACIVVVAGLFCLFRSRVLEAR